MSKWAHKAEVARCVLSPAIKKLWGETKMGVAMIYAQELKSGTGPDAYSYGLALMSNEEQIRKRLGAVAVQFMADRDRWTPQGLIPVVFCFIDGQMGVFYSVGVTP